MKRCEVASNNAKSSCHRCLQPHLSKLYQQTYIPNKESFRDHETFRKRIMTRFFSWTSAHNIIMIKTFQSLLQIWTQWRRAAGYEMMFMVTSSCVCQFLSTSIDQQSLLSTTATWVGVNLCDMLKSMYHIPHHCQKNEHPKQAWLTEGEFLTDVMKMPATKTLRSFFLKSWIRFLSSIIPLSRNKADPSKALGP